MEETFKEQLDKLREDIQSLEEDTNLGISRLYEHYFRLLNMLGDMHDRELSSKCLMVFLSYVTITAICAIFGVLFYNVLLK